MTSAVRHRLEWMLVLAALIIGAAALWTVAQPIVGTMAISLRVASGLLLVLGVLSFTWIYRRGLERSIEQLRVQLDDLDENDGFGQLTVDRTSRMRRIALPLNRCLGSLGRQLEDLRQTNQALQIRNQLTHAHRRQIEEVLLVVSDGVLVTNRYDELTFANEAAERMLGFRAPACLRKNIDQVLSDGSLVRLMREVRQSGLNQPRRIVEHSSDDQGNPRTLQVTFNCLAGPSESLSGVVAILRDISRQKELERNQTEFVSNVSHELKTPLASIKAYVEMLQDGEASDADTREEFYQTISDEADRLHRMIDRILNISRIEFGAVQIAREPVSIAAVVRQVLSVIGPQATEHGVALVDEIPPVFYQVEADFDLICQALTNLLTNAIKYTDTGGTVTVRVQVEENRGVASFDVIDTGMGIAPEEFPKIFQKFYRVRANMKMAGGTGLGLPLVKHIIESIHGGRLSVISTPGEGSTFSFELPLVT